MLILKAQDSSLDIHKSHLGVFRDCLEYRKGAWGEQGEGVSFSIVESALLLQKSHSALAINFHTNSWVNINLGDGYGIVRAR